MIEDSSFKRSLSEITMRRGEGESSRLFNLIRGSPSDFRAILHFRFTAFLPISDLSWADPCPEEVAISCSSLIGFGAINLWKIVQANCSSGFFNFDFVSVSF